MSNSTDKELDKELDKLERIFTIDGEPYSVFDRDRLKALINRAVVAARKEQLESILGRLKPGQVVTRHKLEMRLKHLTKKGHKEDE